MSEYSIEDIRNIALIGHGDSGKTTLAEASLFSAKESNRFGSVDEGTTISDYNQDEIDRKISISASLMHCNWNNQKINMVDTPGYMDFTGEVLSALHAVESAVVVIHAVSGIEVGTEIVWDYCEKKKLPRIVVINKLDKEHADFQNILDTVQSELSKNAVPMQFPVNQGLAFKSIIDLLTMKMYTYSSDKSCKFTKEDIPADHQAKADEMRNFLKENVAESDDDLLEKYLEEGDISEEEFRNGLKKAMTNGSITPVLCTNAEQGMGVSLFMDFISEYASSPLDMGTRSAKKGAKEEDAEIEYNPGGPAAFQVFKTISEQHVGELSFFKVVSGVAKSGMELQNINRNTTERMGTVYSMNGNIRKEVAHISAGDIGAVVKLKSTNTSDTLCEKSKPIKFGDIEFPSPVIRTAISPKSKGDEEKLSSGLTNLHGEDPSFIVEFDPELQQTILSGLGEMHLDIIVKRLKQKMGVDVDLSQPKIPYREAIRGSAKAQGKYKKQSGGRGQYGDSFIEISPTPRGEGFNFINNIVGGSIPGKYIPAVEKGIVEQMHKGALAGYPVVDVAVSLFDGSFHTVDSSDMAFKISGSMAFKKAFLEAKPRLLEPIYQIEVRVPEEFMGDVMGDLSGRRGKIQGMEAEGRFQVIKALVPLAELYKYSTTLRSLTGGRGIHKRKFESYEEVPNEIAEKIIEDAKKEKENE